MDIFGVGYLGFESPTPLAWREYGPEVLGMEIAPSPKGDEASLYLRMDDRRHRLAFHPGPIDKVAYIGWEVRHAFAYRDALKKLQAAQVAVEIGDAALCELRGVCAVARFKDPVGFQHEIFYGQKWDPGSFRPGRRHHGFHAGHDGLGHVVLISPDPVDEVERFFLDVMGFEWFGRGWGTGTNSFVRAPGTSRSHSIAYCYVPGRMGIQHIGLTMKALADVGIAYDLVRKRELPLSRTLGQHTHESIVSFYHFGPTGFIVECLWEESPWSREQDPLETNPERLSTWGHELVGPMVGSAVRPAEELRGKRK